MTFHSFFWTITPLDTGHIIKRYPFFCGNYKNSVGTAENLSRKTACSTICSLLVHTDILSHQKNISIQVNHFILILVRQSVAQMHTTFFFFY